MKKIFSTFLMLLLTVVLFGQYDPRENFYDAEFFLAQEDYEEALYAFTQVYDNGYQDNENINYRIGVCLLNIHDQEAEAIPYLEKAVQNIKKKYKEGNFKEDGAPRDALLYLANAYRIDNQFKEAEKYYQAYLDYGDIKNEIQAAYARAQINSCKKAITATQRKSSFQVGTLGQINKINVPVYNPAISGDLSTIAFMGKQKFYNGVYVSNKIDGKWTKPYNITPSIQSDGNQTVLSLSHEGDKILLAWYDGLGSDIWIAEFKNNRWNRSKPLDKPVNSRFFESHACFTPDGKTIYFTSNRKESLGGMDIFRTSQNADGTWGALELLGENVNSILNEESPFISPDGKRLYFSSQGHDGIGGYDVYYCDINEDGTFGKPVNPDYPLNSSNDDFTFSPREVEFDNSLTLYAKGKPDQVDLFRLEWIPETAQPVVVDFDTPLDTEQQLAEVDNTEDVNTETVEEDIVEDIKEEAEQIQEEVIEEVAGKIESDEKSKLPDADAIVSELKMIRPVYFDFDDHSLSAPSKKKLDDILQILIKYQGVELEIVGHTDAIGTTEYNKRLSQRRANTVADYLLGKGVNADRLKVKGAGESDPIAINRTPDNHDAPQGRALNRRVHFKTTVPGGVYIEIEENNIPDTLKL